MALGRPLRVLAKAWADVSRADAILLASLLAVVLCVWAFGALADRVTAGSTQALDEQLMLTLRKAGNAMEPSGPDWLPGVMRDVTALGSAPVHTLFVLAVGGSLLARRQYHALALLLLATIGGVLLNDYLKGVFARPRPTAELHLTEVRSMSFPSGHAMDSAVVYLTLSALLARLVQGRALRLYFIGLAVFLTVTVGFTRVYLGVHYPSDVLAGWTAGLAWALLCWTGARYLQQRGAVEPAR